MGERARSFASKPLDGSSGDESLRLGKYRVTRELTRAPGAWMVEARQDDGRPVLLQLAHLRPPRVPEENVEQADYVRMIASATEHLASDPENAALHHDVESYADGSRILFWALPYVEGCHRLGHSRTLIGSAEMLIRVALSLLDRMKVRHDRGRLEPLLSEQLVLVHSDGTADLIGLAIHLPHEWLADDMIPARLAPEEKLAQEPRRTGDLWRLGQSLKVIAAELELVPQDLRHVLDRLVEPDSTRRISSALEALAEFTTLLAMAKNWSQPHDQAMLQAAASISNPDVHRTVGVEPRGFHDAASDLDSVPSVPAARMLSQSDPDVSLAGAPSPSIDTDGGPPVRAQAPEEGATPISSQAIPDPDAPTWEPKENATQRMKLPEGPSPHPAQAPTPSQLTTPPDPIRAPSTIPDASTLLDMHPTIRHNLGAREDRGAPVLYQSTVIDEAQRAIPHDIRRTIQAPSNSQMGRRDGSSEATIRDLPRRELEDQGEAPTIDDAALRRQQQHSQPGQPGNAWDRAPGPRRPPTDPLLPMGPQGTVVGVRMIENPTGLRKAPDVQSLLPPPPNTPLGLPERAGGGTPRPPLEGALVPRTLDALVPYDPGEPRPRTPRPDVRRSGEYGQRRSGDVPAPAVPSQLPAGPERSRGVLFGALAFFLAGGVAALVAPYLLPTREPEHDKPPPVVAPPPPPAAALEINIPAIGDVILKSEPEEATVVSEQDGRLIGTTPLRFMVPPGGAPVLVTAEGYEPQRLVLPDRGRVTAELLELQDDKPCDVTLAVPGDRDLVGVAAKIESDTAYTVPGAAVLRTQDGTGAWIVRCPSLGGSETQTLPARSGTEEHELEVLAPLDATVTIDGLELGKVPQSRKLTTKFTLVKVEMEKGVWLERWVPVDGDTKLRLPRPKKKKSDEPDKPKDPKKKK